MQQTSVDVKKKLSTHIERVGAFSTENSDRLSPKLKYTYSFECDQFLESPEKIMGVDCSEALVDYLTSEFKIRLYTIIYGDAAGPAFKEFEKLKKRIELQPAHTIDEQYLDLFIHSLTTDIDKWEHKACGGGDGSTWSEWIGPTYESDNGDKIYFSDCSLGRGCYINGGWGWSTGFTFFAIRSKRLNLLKEALKAMKAHVNSKLSIDRQQKLISAITGAKLPTPHVDEPVRDSGVHDGSVDHA